MNYTQIPNEFFDEMAVLTDEEYGRLIRWMQIYTMTGTDDPSMLAGNERFFAARCKNVMDRFADAYNRKLEGSRKGVEARRKKAEDNHAEPVEDQEEPEVNHRLTIGQPTLTTGDQTINHKPETINHKVYQNDIPALYNAYARERTLLDGIDVPDVCQSVCAEFNRLTGSKDDPSAPYITDRVIALLEQGYTEKDLILTIRKKYDEWKDDPQMCNKIRPSTVLGQKFPEYFAQPPVVHKKKKSRQQRQMDEIAAFLSGGESEVMQIDSG